jgi:uncharacterized metal-binding protein YceD (DUF177 family)
LNDDTAHEFPRPISVLDVPPKGQHLRLEASPDECEALAARLGVEKVLRLAATLEVKPWKSAGICVSGTLDGEVEQACVVTLEPVTNALRADILVYLVRDEPHGARAAERELVVDPLGEDEPDVLQGSTLDLGELVVEHAILAVDPWPRKQGAELPPMREDGEDGAEPGPFAALARLRQRGTDD